MAGFVGDNSRYAGKKSDQSAPKPGSYSSGAAERAVNRAESTPSSRSPSTYGNSWSLDSRRPGPSGPFESSSDNARAKELLASDTGKPDRSGRFFK